VSEIFSAQSTQAQLDKLQREIPAQQVSVGAVVENGDAGVIAQGNVAIGKSGAFVEGEASWMTRAGYRVAAMFGWKGK
jgi:hypothetical protein